MHETGVGKRRQDVGEQVQRHIGKREDEGAGLHHRHIALGDAVHHELAHARVDEHHLDHDHAGDEIGEV